MQYHCAQVVSGFVRRCRNLLTPSRIGQASARREYKRIWERLCGSYDSAKMAVAETTDECAFRISALDAFDALKSTVGIKPTDIVLEIGCGVGRVGRVLAPCCAKWIGADVAPSMLKYAAENLAGFRNVELVETDGFSLDGVADESVDLVYSTLVFMHLDGFERYRYLVEAMRVLKPGGRVYVDNVNLCHELGWKLFVETVDTPPEQRLPNSSKPTTAEEMRLFGVRAGFADMRVGGGDEFWLRLTGVKPVEARRTVGVARVLAPTTFSRESAAVEASAGASNSKP